MLRTATLVISLISAAAFAQAPVGELLKDAKTIVAPGSPGVVLSLKETISPIVLGGLDKGTMGPVIVAGTWGKGRIVAFGHSGYIDKDNLTAPDTAALMERLVNWCATGSVERAGQSKPLAALVLDGDMTPWLTERGFSVAKMDGPPGKITEAALGGATLVIIGGRDLTDAESKLLSKFVKGGGGLLAAQTGWGWQQIKGGPDMRTNSLNKMLAEAGVAWTDDFIEKTAKQDKGFDATKAANGPVTLDKAFDTLLAGESEPISKDKDKAKAQSAVLAQASAIVSRGVRVLPESDTTVLPRLKNLLASHAAELAPTDKMPLDGKHPLLRTLLAVQIDEMKKLPPEKVTAHPAAASFPGVVPSDAQRVTRTVEVDTSIPRWHSLGLYAPAGEVVTVTLPKGTRDLSVRIGSHTDHLWHLPSWKRVPEISRSWKLKEGENRVASAFGGILYIEVDKTKGRGGEVPPVEVKIAGCVEAPLFVLGKTSIEEWKKTIRNAPGPWAELATPSVIITVPSSAVRGLEDPTEICTIWQQVLDNAADFGSIPRKRSSPERYVPDVQISAGYMHSGYPIMTYLDVVEPMSRAEKLKAGNWGLFHELGHNHQKGDWTFEGTGEVTNNLWSLYLMETVAGKTPGHGHDAMDDATKRHDRAKKHIDTGANFEKWKSDPFLALEMYYELREAFGWAPFTKVFAEYQTLKNDEHPKGELEKHDQWMVRMSRAVGKNLGPFFEKWGVPTSQSARDSIKDLPSWMPDWF